MRIILTLMILVFSSQAMSYACPSVVEEWDDANKAYEWLSRFQGKRELHGCELEIIACDKEEESNDLAPVGEILIITPDGREAYLSIDFPEVESNLLEAKVKGGKRAFHYTKIDRAYEELHGRTQVWRFEMGVEWLNLDKLERIELGRYTTNSQLNQPNGNDSHWFTCNPS